MSSAERPEPANASPMPPGVTDPKYRPLPGQLGNMTVTQVHTLEKFKRELKAEGNFVEERMSDAALLRYESWRIGVPVSPAPPGDTNISA